MKQKDERDELKKLLTSSPENIDKNVPDATEQIPGLQAEPVTNVDFIALKLLCEEEATTMIKNAISFMIPLEMLNENEYLKNKVQVDIMSLAGMVYQLRTNEVMQKALIDQINLGMVNARMFEVFTGMSKTIGELNKQLIQTVEAIKETYRTFKNDVKEQRTEALGPQSNSGPSGLLTTSNGSVVTRGTKELINNVKNMKRDIANAELVNNEFIDDAGLIPNITVKDIGIPPIEIVDPPIKDIIM